jgi:Ca2+/Na+ antiporter
MNFLERLQERGVEIRKAVKRQPRSHIVMAVLILCGILYVIFSGGYNAETNQKIEYEIKLAQMICEHSADWVMQDIGRLKMGKSDLKNIKINGESVPLEYVTYPVVLFQDTGIRNIDGSARDDLFCTFPDPRSSSHHFYFNYKKRVWVDRIRFRR